VVKIVEARPERGELFAFLPAAAISPDRHCGRLHPGDHEKIALLFVVERTARRPLYFAAMRGL